jgi:hypothetical protein
MLVNRVANMREILLQKTGLVFEQIEVLMMLRVKEYF